MKKIVVASDSHFNTYLLKGELESSLFTFFTHELLHKLLRLLVLLEQTVDLLDRTAASLSDPALARGI